MRKILLLALSLFLVFTSNAQSLKFSISPGIEYKSIVGDSRMESSLAIFDSRYANNASGFGLLANLQLTYKKLQLSVAYQPVVRYDIIQYEIRNFNPEAGTKSLFTDHHLRLKKHILEGINILGGWSIISLNQGFYAENYNLQTNNHYYNLQFSSIDFGFEYEYNSHTISLEFLYAQNRIEYLSTSPGVLRFYYYYKLQ